MTNTRKTRDKKNPDNGNPVEVPSKSRDVYYALPTGSLIGSSTKQMTDSPQIQDKENTGQGKYRTMLTRRGERGVAHICSPTIRSDSKCGPPPHPQINHGNFSPVSEPAPTDSSQAPTCVHPQPITRYNPGYLLTTHDALNA